MNRIRNRICILFSTILFCMAASLGFAQRNPPTYEVDASWPKPLPNNWLIGQVGGLAVDKHDHVWVLQRPRTLTDDEKGAIPNPPERSQPRSICCKPAPSVMEFDVTGDLLQAWGGPEDPGKCAPPQCLWPASEHGIFVDADEHVWIAGNGQNDRMLLEFDRDGKFIKMIGSSFAGPPDSNSRTSLGRAAGIYVDTKSNEVFVADGYLNSRVVKFDTRTGAFIKAWGAYGKPPSDLPPESHGSEAAGPVYRQLPPDPKSPNFNRPVHCIMIAHDGLVYVCDRANNRIQIFTRDGQYQQQFAFDPATGGNGAIWAIALSPDKEQRFLIYADGENNILRIVDRTSGKSLATFGHSGRNAGQFHWVHQIAVDSKGNIYTGEVDSGKRVQKFVPSGGSR